MVPGKVREDGSQSRKRAEWARKRYETKVLRAGKEQVGKKKGRRRVYQEPKKSKRARKRYETKVLKAEKEQVGKKKGEEREFSEPKKSKWARKRGGDE